MISRKPVTCSVFTDHSAAERYDSEMRKWMRSVAKRFISAAKSWELADGKVLDIGTGTGILAFELALAFPDAEVTGLDLSDIALEIAERNARSSGLSGRVHFQKGDAEAMPFEEGAFDLVISSNTLHLVSNPVRMFDEIQRVLKPGGRFYLSDFRRNWVGILVDHIRASYTQAEVEEMLHRSQLEKWSVMGALFQLNIQSA